MSVESPTDPRPAAKIAMAPLDARAPRPSVVRLRRGVLVGLVMAGAGLVGGSLAWAFVLQPEFRARAQEARLGDQSREIHGAVRPSEIVTDGPATYAQIDQLPEPRHVGKTESGGAPVGRDAARRAPRAPVARRTLLGDARASDLFFAGGGRSVASVTSGDTGASGARKDYSAVYNTHSLLPPLSPHEVKAGTIIPAALLMAIDTAREGPVVATVTENVFDTVTGRQLLIPQGARLIGRHDGESRHGDKRAFITWERLILPNGKSLVLSREPAVDAEGAIGVRGDVDRRLGSLLVATMFAGAITTLGQAARDHDDSRGGWWGDAGDAAAIEGARVGGKLIDRELEVRPSIRLRLGERVRVLVTRDLILEPYG